VDNEGTKFLTPEEAAKRYHKTVAFFWGRGGCKPGLPGVYKFGGKILIDPGKFEKFCETVSAHEGINEAEEK